MTRSLLERVIIRTLAILFWLGVIASVVYVSRWSQWDSCQKSISLLLFPTMVDPEKIAAFEKETGIKVYLNYYDNDRELLHKMHISKGVGYDSVVAPDYVVKVFIKNNYVQPLDRAKLNFLGALDEQFCGHYFDPHNTYSVPYFLSVYGLGIDRDFFGDTAPPPTWKLLFNKQPEGFHVAMTDDSRRAFMLAGKFLFGSLSAVCCKQQADEITRLLIQQKKHVEVYTDLKAEDMLATRDCPVVLTLGSDLWRLSREYPEFDFMVPKEGTCKAIDSFVVTTTTKKQEYVYQLLNYLYQPEILRYHIEQYGFCSPRKDVDTQDLKLFCLSEKQLREAEFFTMPLSDGVIDASWVAVMTHVY